MANTSFTDNWLHAREQAIHQGWEVIEIGWEQHVIIDHHNQRVYRYPRHQAAADKLADEVDVLQSINSRQWSVQLPQLIEYTGVYAIYKYIPGHVLDRKTILGLSDNELSWIGRELGVFLADFHTLNKDIVENKKTKQETSLLEYYEQRINTDPALPYFSKAQSLCDGLKRSNKDSPSVVVHGDLHGLNILIDKTTSQLSGIIDLSEIEVGDPHQDFRKLFMTDERLVMPALLGYKEISDYELDVEQIKLWAYVNEWANLCYFAEQSQNATYKRAVENLKKWQQL